MSIVAEFAARLHESASRDTVRPYVPVDFPARTQRLYDIRAVVFDVYGTLIDYWKPAFASTDGKMTELLAAFRKTADYFGFTPQLQEMNPAASPEQTLHDLYTGLIALDHEKSREKNIEFPEIRIERVWNVLLLMVQRHGYAVASMHLGPVEEVARCAAYYYHFHALGRHLYPGVTAALQQLGSENLRIGAVSNAQFYTPVDLTLLMREQSNGACDDFQELIDLDLTFFSYEYGQAKPGVFLFEKLYDVLYDAQILPSQVVYVGNDLSQDIQTAQKAGMKTAFFCGDANSAFTHDLAGTVVPDLVFTAYDMLPQMISFHEERTPQS